MRKPSNLIYQRNLIDRSLEICLTYQADFLEIQEEKPEGVE